MISALANRTASESIASVPVGVAHRLARAACSVLVTGETGSGKGYLAAWIHRNGPRADRPFVPVNCGALPEGVLDSHLFGHERGAFSDAHRAHQGLVQSADGGTLFLDEVGELSFEAQRRLLRVLEEREVQPVGSTGPRRVDVRVIAATSCNLERMVEERRFRADLFYRLDVIHLDLAPLRERGVAEIERLVDHYNDELAASLGTLPRHFDDSAWRMLRGYAWPGNVRELRTVLERVHVLAGAGTITADDLATIGGLPDDAGDEPRSRDLRLDAARDALARCDGNVSRAAAALGVHRSTVHRWLAQAS